MIGPSYSSSGAKYHSLEIKRNHQESSTRGKTEKMNAIATIFNFRKNDYNLVKNTKFLVSSIFSSSASFGPLMTNDSAPES